jgi:hypothetical protein
MGVYKVTYPGTGKISYGVDYRDPGGRKIRRIVSDRKKVADAIWAKIHVELETGAYYDRKHIKNLYDQGPDRKVPGMVQGPQILRDGKDPPVCHRHSFRS